MLRISIHSKMTEEQKQEVSKKRTWEERMMENEERIYKKKVDSECLVLKTPGGYLVPAKVYDIKKYNGPKRESHPDAEEYCTFVDEYGEKYWIFDGVTDGNKYPVFNNELMIVKGSSVEWPRADSEINAVCFHARSEIANNKIEFTRQKKEILLSMRKEVRDYLKNSNPPKPKKVKPEENAQS